MSRSILKLFSSFQVHVQLIKAGRTMELVVFEEINLNALHSRQRSPINASPICVDKCAPGTSFLYTSA